MFAKKKFFPLAILLVLATIFLTAGCGDDKSSESVKPKVEQSQSVEKKSEPKPLGENWIKDSNGVYLWNPKPIAGESIEWSGGSVVDGDYRFAEGEGTTTWYLNGEIEQIDEGPFRHGQRHGRFTHQFFPSGNIDYSNWDNGVEIALPPPDNSEEAKKAFINYHKAITNRDYRTAYETLSYKQRERVGNFDSYVAGYKNTISSEVSGLKLLSSEEDAYTFEYLLTARDRANGNVKVQTFKGEVTMAKDKGKWYVRYAKSEKIAENREAVESERNRLAAEQKVREKEVAKSSASAELEKATNLSDNVSAKEYLETIQPFALENFTKNLSGIIGPLENGSSKNLEEYAFKMALLAQSQLERKTTIKRAVATYFESRASLAAAYAEFNSDKKGLFDKALVLPIIYEFSNQCSDAEENIRKIADDCGADLSDYAETEAIKRILKVVRNL